MFCLRPQFYLCNLPSASEKCSASSFHPVCSLIFSASWVASLKLFIFSPASWLWSEAMHLSELHADKDINLFLFLGAPFFFVLWCIDRRSCKSRHPHWYGGKEILSYLYVQSRVSFYHTSHWPTPDEFWNVPDAVGETSLMLPGTCCRTALSSWQTTLLDPGSRIALSVARAGNGNSASFAKFSVGMTGLLQQEPPWWQQQLVIL